MARPTTPKMPVHKTTISEVLQRVSNAKTKAEKVKVLQEYKSPALTKVLWCNFSKNIHFVFPSGKTPIESEGPSDISKQLLYTEHKLLDKFITRTINNVTYFGCSGGTKPRLPQIRKESLWINLLDSIEDSEAELLDLVKDKKLTSKYKITKQNVIDAFPELGLDQEE